MKIIVDTHIFLWLLNAPEKINQKYMKQLESTENTIYLSPISVAELMIKKSIEKIEFDFDVLSVAADMGLEVLPFDGMDAIGLGALPFHHKDPFDRMIISQAIAKNYYIISDDGKFGLYDCRLI
jgi:PIN domain nuclease of toxin-antitoxin system